MRKSFKKILAHMLTATMALGSVAGVSVRSAETKVEAATAKYKNDFKCVGYFSNWREDGYLEDRVRWEDLTHAYFAFALPERNGSLKVENETFLTKLVNKCNATNTKATLSVGGWFYDYASNITCDTVFAAATQSDSTSQTLANNIVNYAYNHGFQGVDIDWEYPESSTKNQYTKFIGYLYEKTQAKGMELTAAVSQGSWNASNYSNEALSKMDFITIMCYDGGGSNHSPYSYMTQGYDNWSSKIAKNKIVLGVPFYSQNDVSYGDMVKANVANADKDQTTYNGTTQYYNGRPTMRQKANFCATKNAQGECGGIMIWEMYQDCLTNGYGEYSLLKAIREEVDRVQGSSSGNTPTPTQRPNVTSAPTPTQGGSSVYPTWNSSTVYTGGNEVLWQGKVYRAGWWTQGDQPDLNCGSGQVWTYVMDYGTADPTPTTKVNTPTPTTKVNSPTPTQGASSGTYPAWDANSHAYAVGDMVSYDGKVYRCIFAHTSNSGWTPALAFSLWEDTGMAAGATPTPTQGANVTSGPTPTNKPYVSNGKLPEHVVIGYWHNFNNGSTCMTLAECPDYYDVIDVAFTDNSSVAGEASFSVSEDLYKAIGYTNEQFKQDVETVKARGQHVLISVGGAEGRITINSQAAEDKFYNSMVSIITEYGFEGIDIDLEGGAVSGSGMGYVASALRRLHDHFGDDFIITMAPETLYMQDPSYSYSSYMHLAIEIKDILTYTATQFYNSGPMTGADGKNYTCGTAEFPAALSQIAIDAGLRDDQVAFGFPCMSSAGGGYTSIPNIQTAVNGFVNGTSVGSYNVPEANPHFRGVMCWSINWDKTQNYAWGKAMRTLVDSLPTHQSTVTPTPTNTPTPTRIVTATPTATNAPTVTPTTAPSENGWKQVGSNWYYYKNGTAVTGWFRTAGKWYFFDNSGVMKTGWVKDGGKWYYLDKNGAMKTGWVSIDGKWYYFETSGALSSNKWVKSGSDWYHTDTNGVMMTNKWQKSSGKWYYFGSDGKMVSNTTIKISGVYYTFDADGAWVEAA
jgi:chitinase